MGSYVFQDAVHEKTVGDIAVYVKQVLLITSY